MITTPDRLAAVIAAIERGEHVDWQRISVLSALDLVRAGRQFVEQALLREEHEDNTLEARARNSALVETLGAQPDVAR